MNKKTNTRLYSIHFYNNQDGLANAVALLYNLNYHKHYLVHEDLSANHIIHYNYTICFLHHKNEPIYSVHHVLNHADVPYVEQDNHNSDNKYHGAISLTHYLPIKELGILLTYN